MLYFDRAPQHGIQSACWLEVGLQLSTSSVVADSQVIRPCCLSATYSLQYIAIGVAQGRGLLGADTRCGSWDSTKIFLDCYVSELPPDPRAGAETYLTSKPAEATASKARLGQQLPNGSA